jgi:glutathione synthase
MSSTQRRVAIQMDAPATFKPYTDTTIVLGLEAQRRGYKLYHYHPSDLSWREGNVVAPLQEITFHASQEHWFDVGSTHVMPLSEMDVVLMRQDPPYDMSYLSATYLLEMLPKTTLVVNDPAAVRDCPEKIFPLMFAQFMPPTLVTSHPQMVRDFLKEYSDIVLKPLYGYGGMGVFRLKSDGDNVEAILETVMSAKPPLPFMAQRFLPEVRDGDKRIILMDGKVEGVLGRIPAQGEIRANFRAGGSAATGELTPKQLEICDAVGHELVKRNLIFAGLDVIGDYLTEINLTSPTALPAIKRLTGVHPEIAFWDAIEWRIDSNSK